MNNIITRWWQGQKAKTALMVGDTEMAIACFRQLHSLTQSRFGTDDQRTIYATIHLAWVLLKKGDPDSGRVASNLLATIEEPVKRRWSEGAYLLELLALQGKCALHARDFANALQLLQKAVSILDNSTDLGYLPELEILELLEQAYQVNGLDTQALAVRRRITAAEQIRREGFTGGLDGEFRHFNNH